MPDENKKNLEDGQLQGLDNGELEAPEDAPEEAGVADGAADFGYDGTNYPNEDGGVIPSREDEAEIDDGTEEAMIDDGTEDFDYDKANYGSEETRPDEEESLDDNQVEESVEEDEEESEEEESEEEDEAEGDYKNEDNEDEENEDEDKSPIKKKAAKTLLKLIPPYVWAIIAGVCVGILFIVILISMFFAYDPDSASGVGNECNGKTTIVIDPGHISENANSYEQDEYDADERNGTGSFGTSTEDPPIASTISERLVNQEVSNHLKEELESKGYKVLITKTEVDGFASNRERGQLARDNNADLILKIHNDGYGPEDGMIFYSSNETVIRERWDAVNEIGEYISRRDDEIIAKDQEIAASFTRSFRDAVQEYDIKYSNGNPYPVSHRPHGENSGFGYTYNIPTSLIEMSSMRVAPDNSFIKDSTNYPKLAKAIADAVEDYIPPVTGSCGGGLCVPYQPLDPTSTTKFSRIPEGTGYSLVSGEGYWGTPEIISLLQGVAAEWNSRHPDITIQINDISLKNGGHYPPHVSHKTGIDVDINSNSNNPNFIMTHPPYDPNLAIELGKLYMDTGAIVFILYNDTDVQAAVNSYANSEGLPGTMKTASGHANHFHIRIDPLLYATKCGFELSESGAATN